MSDSLQPYGHTRVPCPSLSPRVCSDSCPLCRWCDPTTSSVLPSLSALKFSQQQGLFQWVGFLHQVAKVLEKGKPLQYSCLENPMNSMKRQEYHWSGLPFPSAKGLPNPETEPASPALPVDSSPLGHLGRTVKLAVKKKNNHINNPNLLSQEAYILL